MKDDRYGELEKRIKSLEERLSKISFSEAKEVTMTHCPIGEVFLKEDCKINIQHSSIGSVIDGDLNEAEERLDDLEDRLEELIDSIDETESKIDELCDDRLEDLEHKLEEINEGIDEAKERLEEMDD